jgi:TrmH family RNA methyltransferase
MSDLITSKANPKVKLAFSYKQKPGDHFLVEGFHAVSMALENQMVEELFLLKEDPKFDVPQHIVTPEIIEKLALSQSPEGIVAVCHKKEEAPLSSDRVLYLDLVQDPGNLGTLLRTALSFGFHDVILSQKACSPYNPKALMAAQGATFSLNVIVSKAEAAQDIASLKKQGYFILGTALKEAVAFETFKIPESKIVLVLGNEGQGVEPAVLSLCDQRVKISMSGIDSLNVGVAGGILMHALTKSTL